VVNVEVVDYFLPYTGLYLHIKPAKMAPTGGIMSRYDERIDGVPQNLALVYEGDQSGYQIQSVYSLELKHGLMGSFPAIYRETQIIVVTTNENLIREVWKTLSPRRSILNCNDFYVNEQLGVGYPLPTWFREADNCPAMRLLTLQRYNELMKTREPFQWAPGLIGDDMTPQEFIETVKATQVD
jgi:hypothetical protein